MSIRVAINGFGRIGRNTFKAGFGHPELEFVAINDPSEANTLVHLLKYDSVFRTWNHDVSAEGSELIIDGKRIALSAERDPALLQWKKYNVDVVLECTGRFTNKEDAAKHLTAGAKRVIVSAPAKGGVPTFVLGANAESYKGENLINNASCTTNCIAPVASIMVEKFGVQKAIMSTIHAVTAEQNLVDGAPPGGKKGDMRRARAAYAGIIPTTTGGAIATAEAIPELKGLFDGIAFRVPVMDVSLTDFVFLLKKKTTVEEINATLSEAAEQSRYKGILGVTTEQLVSSDFIGSSFSSIADLSLTKVIDGDLVKIVAWYDNEWGYSCRLAEMAALVGKGL
ncbi:type I glyceraldehyde-3-phosphate dehydrogenase [Candidatus Uhrbacteria bacterium]|nr:type I glyceraldehyde-3-phosphate dehydrogenase [Candidatus Uhrbacteria bacterium]